MPCPTNKQTNNKTTVIVFKICMVLLFAYDVTYLCNSSFPCRSMCGRHFFSFFLSFLDFFDGCCVTGGVVEKFGFLLLLLLLLIYLLAACLFVFCFCLFVVFWRRVGGWWAWVGVLQTGPHFYYGTG